MKPRFSLHLAVALAWLVFAVWWTILNTVDADLPLLKALMPTARNVGPAWLLSYGVWWVSGVVPWRRGPSLGFFSIHLVASMLFSLLWMGSLLVLMWWQYDWGWQDFLERGGPFGWRGFMGVLLYAVIVGVSYSVRTERRVADRDRTLTETRALLAEVRMEALLARLNPHFLFNALHCVSGLLERDPESARKAILRLGDMLRYVLAAHKAPDALVSLGQELEFVDDYVGLESLRLGPRLDYAASVEETAGRFRVPPLLLQPLVENAVLHGVAPHPRGGRVRLSAQVEADHLALRVRNSFDPMYRRTGQGIGLATLRQRMELHYGRRGSVESRKVEEDVTWWFTIEILIPRSDPAIP